MFGTLTSGATTLYLAHAAHLGAIVPPGAIFPREVLTPGAVACGPMFSGGHPDYLLHDSARGVAVSSRHPSRGATVSVRDGRAEVAAGAVEGAPVAVQGYPWIVRAGAVHASTDTDAETTGRVALCVMGDGRVAVAVATVPMHRFARELAAAGVVDAVYLDGGGSTYVRANGRTHGDGARRLPSYVTLAKHETGGRSTGVGAVLAFLVFVAAKRRARR